jgi:hypothetical protein
MDQDASPVASLREELSAICQGASAYFGQVRDALETSCDYHRQSDVLTPEHQAATKQLRQKLASFGISLLRAVRNSPLLEQTDQTALTRVLRGMTAALSLKQYQYYEAYVISDEDQFRGVMPASQEETDADLSICEKRFMEGAGNIQEKLDLLAPVPANLAAAIAASQIGRVRKVRPNTAFIMMHMDDAHADLEDVKNTLKDVFKEFGIAAIRADDIEHSGVATQRVLDEIASSEFLVADLTGARPSVYYELGYAHALETRPILYRKKGTPLHFDVLVHNCPEYKNVTELKEKLRARLEEMTGRKPKR